MIERHEWTTHKDHGNAGPQEEQYGKFYHGTTSQGQKFKRTGTEKVSVTSLIKQTLLLYLFIYLLTLLNYFNNENMGAANQINLGTKLDSVETPWQFSASAYSIASGW